MRTNDDESCSLLTKQELAKKLNVSSIRVIEEMMRSRKIPFLKLSYRTVRFDWRKVQSALARLEVSEVK